MDCPVVTTTVGKVRGRLLNKAKTNEAKQVYAYLGIPFGKPPVGELRFEPPEKAEPWEGTFDAIKSPASPMQNLELFSELNDYFPGFTIIDEDNKYQSEDCLNVTVYTSNPDESANMPVLFWIFGGGFTAGSNVYYNGQVICGLRDVVLVVPNYRVNVFGFLSMGQETKWKGNMGLMDQVMALEWTKDNIKNFGGNPNNVTIIGESAGGISVALHVVSPRSRGLFHRAVSNSGLANMPMLIQLDQSALRKLLLDELKIEETEPEAIMKELKRTSAKTIVKALKNTPPGTYFQISIDGTFLPDTPENLLKLKNFAPVPYLSGVNSTEGSGMLSGEYPPSFFEGFDQETAMEVAGALASSCFPKDKAEEALKLVSNEYIKNYGQDDRYKWSWFVGDLMGDCYFVVPAIEHALIHSGAGHPMYLYQMTQKIRLFFDEEYGGGKKKLPFCEADHGDDLLLTFGAPMANGKSNFKVKFTEEETELSKQWINYICNFAETGDPNKGCKEVSFKWPRYTPQDKKHLNLRWPLMEGQDLGGERYKLWKEVVATL